MSEKQAGTGELGKVEREYAISAIGTPFIDALIEHGIIERECTAFTITGEAGKPISVVQSVLNNPRGLNDPDTLASLADLAASRVRGRNV